MAYYRMSGSSKGELHGASVSVSTSFDDLVGKNVYLYLGSELKQTKAFGEDKTVSFNDILDVGTYTVKVDDTETYKSVDVLISAEEIINRTVKTISIVESGIELVVGNTYSFGGYDWTCAEEIDGGYVLQSQGVTSGAWSGYIKNGNAYYNYNIDGEDISQYYTATQTLYNNIKYAEKTGASYGDGLFLVTNEMCGTTTHQGAGSGYYLNALKIGADNASSFGSPGRGSWIGTLGQVSNTAWNVGYNGLVYGQYGQENNLVIAPAFNLDKTKAYLSGTTILVK